MNVNVKIIGAIHPPIDTFSIHLKDGGETVGDIKTKIASHLKLQESAIRLLFSGQFLSNDQLRAADLELGPSTVLNALLVDVSTDVVGGSVSEERKPQSVENKPDDSRQWRPRFFVYCKNYCGDLTPGKLRVRCSICRSSSMLVRREPNSWIDVLSRGAIRCQCLENNCSPSLKSDNQYPAAEFYFKCARCSNEEGAVPLTQVKFIRKQDGSKTCSICCEDEDGLRILFSCESAHATCLNCFVAYAIDKLERRGFVMHPNYGYTLACPEPRCRDGFIVDAHHLRLLGITELYEKYHRLAAEIYLLGEGGLYCPRQECSEAFISDSTVPQERHQTDDTVEKKSPDRKFVMCPKCQFVFCYYCRVGASECHCDKINTVDDHLPYFVPRGPEKTTTANDDTKSYATIRWTTKACPKCRAPTEKNEGCNHMACGQCSFDWCWDCEKGWTEQCQWDHWFE